MCCCPTFGTKSGHFGPSFHFQGPNGWIWDYFGPHFAHKKTQSEPTCFPRCGNASSSFSSLVPPAKPQVHPVQQVEEGVRGEDCGQYWLQWHEFLLFFSNFYKGDSNKTLWIRKWKCNFCLKWSWKWQIPNLISPLQLPHSALVWAFRICISVPFCICISVHTDLYLSRFGFVFLSTQICLLTNPLAKVEIHFKILQPTQTSLSPEVWDGANPTHVQHSWGSYKLKFWKKEKMFLGSF